MLVKVPALHLPALSRDPLLQLQLTSGAAIQMLMRNPRPLLYLEVSGEPDTVCSPSAIWGREGYIR